MKVLLVEDDSSLREGMTELVSELADVVPVSTVDEALRLLSEDVFDLVLTDLRIGGAKDGGRRVTSAARTGCMPVVIVSALVRDEIEQILSGLQPDAILSKPFQLEEALAVTERFLSRRREVEACISTRPANSAFVQVAPGYEEAVLQVTPDRQVRWFRLGVEGRAEWQTHDRQLSVVVEGELMTNGSERRAGHGLHLPPSHTLSVYSRTGALGVSVVTSAGGARKAHG